MVQRDPDICNNCFRLTAVTEQRGAVRDTFREDGETHVWWREVELPNRRWDRNDTTSYQQDDRLTQGTIRSCVCGLRGYPLRPVDRETAMSYVERIADRLDEKDITFSPDRLRIEAWSRLTEPEWQGKQDSAIGAALEVAIDEI